MNESQYYELWTSTTDPIEPDDAWCERFDADHCCQGCHAMLSHVNAVDAVVMCGSPQTDFSFVDGVLTTIVSRSLLACFGEKVISRDLWVGRVTDARGREYSDYVTIRGRHQNIIRGSSAAEYRQCDICGSHIYFPIADSHLIRSSMTGHSIYETRTRFVVNEEIYQRISARSWKDLHLDPLPIRDKPCDGLGELVIQ